jgi:hypothetical protein
MFEQCQMELASILNPLFYNKFIIATLIYKDPADKQEAIEFVRDCLIRMGIEILDN